ncbi:hypothetical protein ACFQ51_46825 [Streptomyces kaempferi]
MVAGCGGNCFPASQATYVYDPQADAWSQVANYPITDSWLSCAGIDGQVVCAAGPIRSAARRRRRHTHSTRSPARGLPGPTCRTRTGRWPPPPPADGCRWSAASPTER